MDEFPEQAGGVCWSDIKIDALEAGKIPGISANATTHRRENARTIASLKPTREPRIYHPKSRPIPVGHLFTPTPCRPRRAVAAGTRDGSASGSPASRHQPSELAPGHRLQRMNDG